VQQKKFKKRIGCIGAGYVGGPTMAVIAAQCPEYLVTVVDINAKRIAAWQTEDLPIYEPGLLDIVKKARGKNLVFSSDIDSAIRDADILSFRSILPRKPSGKGPARPRTFSIGRRPRETS